MLAILCSALLAQALSPAPAAAVSAGAPSEPSSARPIGDAVLDAQLRAYFAGEKREAWAWVGAGVAALGAGGALSSSSSDAAHGASYPLLDISVVQLGAALYLFWRSGDELNERTAQLARDPCAFLAEEPARMHRVVRRFSIALPIEAAALVGGAAMAGLGGASHHDFLQGAGWGLVAQSAVLLVFDGFAAVRAQGYARELDEGVARHACAAR